MTGREPSRFDTDPEALAWARARVTEHLDRLDRNIARVAYGERWKGAAGASQFIRRALVGDDGCVFAAFDARRSDPALAAALADDDGGPW